MSDSIPSKRRWSWRGSSDDFIFRSEDMLAPLRSEDVLLFGGLDFNLRSEDMLAPLRSGDVLLGGGLGALTSEDFVKEFFLPDPAATAAAVAAKTGEKSKAPDRGEKIGELGARPGRIGTGGNARITSRDWNYEGESVDLNLDPSLFDVVCRDASLHSLLKTPRIPSRDWIWDPSLFCDAAHRDAMAEQLAAPSPPPSISLAGHLPYPSLKPTNAPLAASAAKTNATPSASAATKKTKKKNRKRMLDETAVAEPNKGVMAGQSAASPPPLNAPSANHLACHPRSSAPAPPAASAAKTNAPPSAPATTKKNQNRKRMIDETNVAEPSEGDVLSGRGGGTNVHPGNVRFRKKARELKPWHEKSSKKEKEGIADILVEFVRGSGNRFLKKGKDGLWHEMIGKGPHLKASQVLRDV